MGPVSPETCSPAWSSGWGSVSEPLAWNEASVGVLGLLSADEVSSSALGDVTMGSSWDSLSWSFSCWLLLVFSHWVATRLRRKVPLKVFPSVLFPRCSGTVWGCCCFSGPAKSVGDELLAAGEAEGAGSSEMEPALLKSRDLLLIPKADMW